MNKTLRFSLLSLLMLLCMGVGAQTTVKFDFTGDEAYGMKLLSGNTSEYNADPYTCEEGDITLTLNGKTRWWKASKGNELRFYKESDMVFSVPAGMVITNVTLDAKTPGNFTSAVGTYADGVWTGAAAEVTISTTITESNTPVSTISVTYQDSDEPVKADPQLAFSESTVSASLGAEFTAPTLTKATTAAPAYSSSNEDVATVDAITGAVTLVAAGTTVITATVEETEEYAAGSASYTLTVTAPVLDEVSVPYSESFSEGIGSFTIDDVSLGDGITYVWKHDDSYHYMKASAYAGRNVAAESWLVSPWINIPSADTTFVSFDHCINKYFGDVTTEATVMVMEEGGEWTQCEIAYPELGTGNWSDFLTTVVPLTGYSGKKVKVGFKYVSTDEHAGTWEVRNFAVSVTNPTGIAGVEADAEEGEQVIYNLAGQRLAQPQKGLNIINGKKVIVK